MLSGISTELLYCAAKVESSFLNPRTGQLLAGIGTGFFVQNAAGAVCFVTNRHVIDKSYNPDDAQAPQLYELRELLNFEFFR